MFTYHKNNYQNCNTVLFDGHCQLCVRSIRMLLLFDWLGLFLCLDFRQAQVMKLIECVTLEQLEDQMVLITKYGQIKFGFNAWRYIVNKLPVCFLPSLLLYIPFVSSIGNWLYKMVARSRMGLVHCSPGTCNADNVISIETNDLKGLSIKGIQLANDN